MAAILLDAADVRELLAPEDCMAALEEAFAASARGAVVQPLRVAAWRPDQRGAMAGMPAFVGDPPILGAKLIAVFPENRRRGLPSHQGVVVLHDPEDGRLLAIVDAGAVTALRTAAASALATKLLAREDAAELALLGSGEQAWEHLRALRAVRPIRRVRVWSRAFGHARDFAERAEREYDLPAVAVSAAEQAVRGAEIICTVTAATSPILRGDWLSEGAHVNAVGASTPAFRELDAAAVARSRLFTDSRASLAAESSDYLGAIREGAIAADHLLGELADLIVGRLRGRTDRREITLFKSLGLALEDLAAAHAVLRRAKEQGRGKEAAFGAE